MMKNLKAQFPHAPAKAPARRRTALRLGVALDVLDEVWFYRITPVHLDRMMAAIKQVGFHRLYWIHINERMGLYHSRDPDHPNLRANVPLYGRLLTMGRAAAKRQGLEFIVTYKPYEWGGLPVDVIPLSKAGQRPGLARVGEWIAWYNRRILDHPDWRLHHRLPARYNELIRNPLAHLTLHFLPKRGLERLASKLNLAVSRDNETYEPYERAHSPCVTIVRHRLVDYFGRLQNPADGLALRVEWRDLRIGPEWKYIAVTGPKADWAILPSPWINARDNEGRKLPLSFGVFTESVRKVGVEDQTGKCPYRFDQWGWGTGTVMQHACPTFMGLPFAIARERNHAWPGGPCEAEPGVRRAWRDDVDEILSCRPDGLEIRLQAHGMSSDDPYALTQNAGLDRELARRKIDPADAVSVMRARADIFLGWIKEARRKTRAAKIPLILPQQTFWANPDPPRLCLQSQPKLWPAWTEWLDAGDEVMLREHFYQAYAPDLALSAKERAVAQRKPVWLQLFASQAGGHLRVDIVDEVVADPLIHGVVIYEWSEIRDRHDPTKLRADHAPALARLGLAV